MCDVMHVLTCLCCGQLGGVSPIYVWEGGEGFTVWQSVSVPGGYAQAYTHMTIDGINMLALALDSPVYNYSTVYYLN